MARVLVIEDDPTMARLLADGLRADGHEAVVERTGAAGILAATSSRFDLVASDVMLPDVDGFEICAFLRGHDVETPILLLTARDAVGDRVRGLDAGADDYLVKPFAFAEFAARVRALLRRPGSIGVQEAVCGPLRFSASTREIEVGGRPLSLSRREAAVLRVLLERAGETVGRDVLLEEVWGTTFVEATIVDQYIRYVRRKLGGATDAVQIETVRGIGYRLVEAS